MKIDLMKYVLMSKKEERIFMSECINGKPSYSDCIIAFSLVIKSCKESEKKYGQKENFGC